MREIKVMSDLENKVSDTATKFLFRLVSNGVNQQLSGDEVSVSIANDGYLFDVKPRVVDDFIELDFTDENLTKLTPGRYNLEINVTKSNGTVEVYPSAGSISFEVAKNLKGIEGELVPSVTFDYVFQVMDEKLQKVKAGPQGIQGETGPVGPKGDKGDGFEVNEFGIPITKRMPMNWVVYHETSPWKIAFDNGSILILTDYAMLATLYGVGYSAPVDNATLAAYPLPVNIIRIARGHVTLDYLTNTAADGTWTYWAEDTEVINPVQDMNLFDWSNVQFKDGGGPYGSRQKNFARVLFQLGILSETEVISLGAVRK